MGIKNILVQVIQRLQKNNWYVILAIILIIVMTFSFTINEKMHESTKGDIANLSNYFGAVITNMKYGKTGYIGYKEVLNVLKNNNGFIDNTIINKALALSSLSTDDYYTLGPMDVGYIDYCRFAFFLYGPQVDSLLLLYFSIFCVCRLLPALSLGGDAVAG